MAYQRQAGDSDEQDGTDAQAIDCHGQVLEEVVYPSDKI